jgi:hypothetical protein
MNLKTALITPIEIYWANWLVIIKPMFFRAEGKGVTCLGKLAQTIVAENNASNPRLP